jgi:hypothetical protein
VIYSPQILEFKKLDDFEDLSSDFPALRKLVSLLDLGSLCNLIGLNSPFFLNKLPSPDAL